MAIPVRSTLGWSSENALSHASIRARAIHAFVTGTDENLAKAATQLGNLVKGLQDTLDEFDPMGVKLRA
jgi:hypothetical protein